MHLAQHNRCPLRKADRFTQPLHILDNRQFQVHGHCLLARAAVLSEEHHLLHGVRLLDLAIESRRLPKLY
jgi:hypothetical protein